MKSLLLNKSEIFNINNFIIKEEQQLREHKTFINQASDVQYKIKIGLTNTEKLFIKYYTNTATYYVALSFIEILLLFEKRFSHYTSLIKIYHYLLIEFGKKNYEIKEEKSYLTIALKEKGKYTYKFKLNKLLINYKTKSDLLCVFNTNNLTTKKDKNNLRNVKASIKLVNKKNEDNITNNSYDFSPFKDCYHPRLKLRTISNLKPNSKGILIKSKSPLPDDFVKSTIIKNKSPLPNNYYKYSIIKKPHDVYKCSTEKHFRLSSRYEFIRIREIDYRIQNKYI